MGEFVFYMWPYIACCVLSGAVFGVAMLVEFFSDLKRINRRDDRD
jgi:heme exporter protein D